MGRLEKVSYTIEHFMPLAEVLLEKEYVWLRLMDFVMLPSQTLSNHQDFGDLKLRQILSYLSYAEATPFLLPEQLQSSFGSIEIFLGDLLEHVFG